ncbi:phospholipase D-like domain-containing protein [Methylobacterium platani]
MESIKARLGLNSQVVGATLSRLMRFGLIELRTSPVPVLATSTLGQQLIRSGQPLPERTVDREIPISLIYERVGQSVFRRRDVDFVLERDVGQLAYAVRFSRDERDETDETMALRVGRFMAGSMRPGEWLRGVRAINSVLRRVYLKIDLNDAKNGVFPKNASDELVAALRATVSTGSLPSLAHQDRSPPPPIETEFDASNFLVGSAEHVDRFVEIVNKATQDVFVLSTFVASQADEKGREQRDRIIDALDKAIKRGVTCHLFFGTSLDENAKHAHAMEEIRVKLEAGGRSRGYLKVHRDPVRSHAKFLAADDGAGGAVVVIGSCNWLSSPFLAVEVSVLLREAGAAAAALDVLRAIVAPLHDASRSRENLRFMAAELRRSIIEVGRHRMEPSEILKARFSVVYSADHDALLRRAAHDAKKRFICCTHRLGAPMVPALFTPAEVAGRRLEDVRVLYSRQTGPVKRRHVSEQRTRLHGVVDVIGVRDPQLHCKFLLWDDDDVVVSTMNWGSQSGRADDPMDEIGIHLEGPGLAAALLDRVEQLLPEADDP